MVLLADGLVLGVHLALLARRAELLKRVKLFLDALRAVISHMDPLPVR